jgi:hypothetical protein
MLLNADHVARRIAPSPVGEGGGEGLCPIDGLQPLTLTLSMGEGIGAIPDIGLHH